MYALPTPALGLPKAPPPHTNLSAPSWTSLILSLNSQLIFVEKKEVVGEVLRSASVATEGVREGDMVSVELIR